MNNAVKIKLLGNLQNYLLPINFRQYTGKIGSNIQLVASEKIEIGTRTFISNILIPQVF